MEEKIAEAMEAQMILEEEREQKVIAIRKREVILSACMATHVRKWTDDFWKH